MEEYQQKKKKRKKHKHKHKDSKSHETWIFEKIVENKIGSLEGDTDSMLERCTDMGNNYSSDMWRDHTEENVDSQKIKKKSKSKKVKLDSISVKNKVIKCETISHDSQERLTNHMKESYVDNHLIMIKKGKAKKMKLNNSFHCERVSGKSLTEDINIEVENQEVNVSVCYSDPETDFRTNSIPVVDRKRKKHKKNKRKLSEISDSDTMRMNDEINRSTVGHVSDTEIEKKEVSECRPQDTDTEKNILGSIEHMPPVTKNDVSGSNANYSQMCSERLADLIHETNKICAEENKILSEKFKDYLTKGRFSEEEDEQIKKNWQTYFEMFPHAEPHLFIQPRLIEDKVKRDAVKNIMFDTHFWVKIGKNILRTNFIIQKRCKLLFSSLHSQHKKYKAEEDRTLMEYYAKYGRKWKKIANHLGGRSAESIYERFKKLKAAKKYRWSSEEDESLIKALKMMNSGTLPKKYSGINWIEVAKSVKQRSARQCMEKWLLTLSKPDVTSFSKYRVQAADQLKLIETIASLNVKREKDIDWNVLSSSFASMLSPRTLQNYWISLKRTNVPDFKTKSLSEIICDLKSTIPLLEKRARRQKNRGKKSIAMSDGNIPLTSFKSKEFISSSDDSDS